MPPRSRAGGEAGFTETTRGLQGHEVRGLRPACPPRAHARLPADLAFITTATFMWKVSAITVVSCLPLYVLKYLKRKLSPPSYSKLTS